MKTTKKQLFNDLSESKKILKYFYFNKEKAKKLSPNFENIKITLKNTEPATIEKHCNFLKLNGSRLDKESILQADLIDQLENIIIYSVLFTNECVMIYIIEK